MHRGTATGTGTTIEMQKWRKEMRGFLIILAILVASLTYGAALNPPGGFWPDTVEESHSKKGHTAGTPILQDVHRRRYEAFLGLNTAVFLLSLVIILTLMSETIYRSRFGIRVLESLIVADLFGLMGAYATGSTTIATRYIAPVGGVVLIITISFAAYYRVRNGGEPNPAPSTNGTT